MSKIIYHAKKTLQALDTASQRDDQHRQHLGASTIGEECDRRIWLGFRWAKNRKLDGRVARLFARGKRWEAEIMPLLRAGGITVWDVDHQKKQFRVSAVEGHFGGSLDGVGQGLPDLPKTLACLIECKTHNDESFQEVKLHGVESSQPRYYVQMQCYLYLAQLKVGLYLAVNKNTDELYGELLGLDVKCAQGALRRAECLIWNDEAPPRIQDQATAWPCRFCDYKNQCFFADIPAINCRTCHYAHPSHHGDGSWECRQHRPEIATQLGCPQHIFNISLLQNWVVLVNSLPAYLECYTGVEKVRLGPNYLTSVELQKHGTTPF